MNSFAAPCTDIDRDCDRKKQQCADPKHEKDMIKRYGKTCGLAITVIHVKDTQAWHNCAQNQKSKMCGATNWLVDCAVATACRWIAYNSGHFAAVQNLANI